MLASISRTQMCEHLREKHLGDCHCSGRLDDLSGWVWKGNSNYNEYQQVSGRPARASRSPGRVRHPGDTLPVPTHDLTYRRSTIRRSDDQRSDDRRSTINDQYSTLFSSGPLLRETCHLYCTSNRCSKIKLRTGPDVTHSLPVRILDLIP